MVIIDQLIVIQVDDTKSALKATDLMRIKGCSDTSFVSLGTVYLIAIAIQK